MSLIVHNDLYKNVAEGEHPCTQDIIDWAKNVSTVVSVYAFDAAFNRFTSYISSSVKHRIQLCYLVNDNHLWPITDEHIKRTVTEGRVTNLYKHISEYRFSKTSDKTMVENDDFPRDTLVILPEPIDIRKALTDISNQQTSYIEYLYIGTTPTSIAIIYFRKTMSTTRESNVVTLCTASIKLTSSKFKFRNQSWTKLVTDMFAIQFGHIDESNYNESVLKNIDENSPRALQQYFCDSEKATYIDISKCYPQHIDKQRASYPAIQYL